MTLSRETSAVLRGEGLDRLPIAMLVGAARPEPHSTTQTIDEPEGADRGPSVDELVADAYQRGFADGSASADAAVRKDVAAAITALDTAASALEGAVRAWEQSDPDRAVDLALQLTEMILMREVATSADPGRDAIVRCLREVDRGEQTVVRLSPADVDALGSLDGVVVDRSFEVVADPSVATGDAVADTANGSIDARIRSSLDRVRQELLS